MTAENVGELLLRAAEILREAIETHGEIERNRQQFEAALSRIEAWLDNGHMRSEALVQLVREIGDGLPETERRKLLTTVARILRDDAFFLDAVIDFKPRN